MTPSQFRAVVQKVQREQKRAIDNYNREVRNYNSKVRADSRQVENQRRRINLEIARLNARPASTTFTTYRASTATFVRTYSTVESSLASRPVSPIARRFVDLASDETANSVYLVNALDGDGAPEDDPTEDELRAPSMATELAAFGHDLVSRWTGALYALSPHNPDAARHFCTSAREVIITILDGSAPDAEVKREDPNCEVTDKGAPTRKAKISYLLRWHGVTDDGITSLVDEDVTNVLSLFRTFNDGTHGHAGRFTINVPAASSFS